MSALAWTLAVVYALGVVAFVLVGRSFLRKEASPAGDTPRMRRKEAPIRMLVDLNPTAAALALACIAIAWPACALYAVLRAALPAKAA